MPRNRGNYLAKVDAFITQNGPDFKLSMLDHDQARACDCCGYYPIKAHYHVKNNNDEEFIIGSECQTLVLDFTEAHLPAAMVRKLNKDQLVTLAAKYGVHLHPSNYDQAEMSKVVITARRRFANSQGWASRRSQKKLNP